MLKMLSILRNSGFFLKFSNGYLLVVKFGPQQLCEARNIEVSADYPLERKIDRWDSDNAEIMVYDSRQGSYVIFAINKKTRVGYVNADSIAQLAVWLVKQSALEHLKEIPHGFGIQCKETPEENKVS